jgi:hypothetical protein
MTLIFPLKFMSLTRLPGKTSFTHAVLESGYNFQRLAYETAQGAPVPKALAIAVLILVAFRVSTLYRMSADAIKGRGWNEGRRKRENVGESGFNDMQRYF